MLLIAPISPAQRLLPRPARKEQDAAHARGAAPGFAVAAPARSHAIWTLSHETAMAACAVQMLGAQRRGLKADAAERARYARAYAANDRAANDETAPDSGGAGAALRRSA